MENTSTILWGSTEMAGLADAFWEAKPRKEGSAASSRYASSRVGQYRDRITVDGDIVTYLLWEHPIAQWNRANHTLKIDHCGWNTVTTRNRIDNILWGIRTAYPEHTAEIGTYARGRHMYVEIADSRTLWAEKRTVFGRFHLKRNLWMDILHPEITHANLFDPEVPEPYTRIKRTGKYKNFAKSIEKSEYGIFEDVMLELDAKEGEETLFDSYTESGRNWGEVPVWLNKHPDRLLYELHVQRFAFGCTVEYVVQEKGYDLAGSTIFKVVAYNKHEDRKPEKMDLRGIFLIGKEYTGQWWLHYVPKEYWDASIEECEAWLLNIPEDEQIVKVA